MALRSLNEIRGLKDPVKQFQVELVLNDVPAIALARASQNLFGKISGNTALVSSEELVLRCTKFSYPGARIAQDELIIMGHRRKRGTIQNRSGVFKCTVVETMEGGVLNLIEAWCDLIHSNLLGTRVPSLAYIGEAVLTFGERVNSGDLAKREIHLKGFYPISYSVSDIETSSSEPITIDIEFNYDYYAGNSYSIMGLFN